MRPIVIVLIVLALGAALVAAFLVKSYLDSQTPPPVATQVQTGTQNVLVAAKDIMPGTVLTDEDIRWEPWPDTALDERFVVQPPQVEGQSAAAKKEQDPRNEFLERIARRAIMKGEPMTKAMVIKQGDSSVTAANIAPGKRAVTISISPPQGVAGLVLPNDRVDIVLSLSVRDLTDLEGWKDVVLRYSAETILRDIRVVAINQKLAHKAEDGVAEPGNLVTLELDPGQAERLRVAEQLGTLSLALRSMVLGPDDKDNRQTFTMDIRASRSLSALVALDLEVDEGEMPADAAAAVELAKERAKRRTEVKINRGGSIAIQKFGQ